MIARPLAAAVLLASAAACAQSAGVPHPAFPGPETPLGAHIAKILHDDPIASRAHWGIAVTTLDGAPLFGFNESQLFRPASNNKLFTTATALALLGPETRVTTIVSADAPPDANGVITGDITLHGVGDPALSGRHYPYETPEQRKARLAILPKSTEDALPNEVLPMDDLAKQIAAAGVKSLTGNVEGDTSLWTEPGYGNSWDQGDAVWGYGAAVTALTFNDSQLELTVHPGPAAGLPATIQLSPNVDFAGMPINKVMTTADAHQALVDIAPRAFPAANIAVGAVAVGHSDSEEISVQNPALFAATVLLSRMHANGITDGHGAHTMAAPDAAPLPTSYQIAQPVDLTPKPEAETSPICGRDFHCGIVLAKHVSPTVAEDVTVTLKVSQNLHAEMFLRRLGRAYGTEGSFDQGARVVRHWLTEKAGLDGEDFAFFDGSGLSSHDLVAPRATARLLTFAAAQPWFPQWKAALPVGGVDGSLESRFTSPALKGKVFAKTGTLGESRALAGYLVAKSGKTVVFSVMVDTHAPYGSDDRTVMDDIVAAIAAAE